MKKQTLLILASLLFLASSCSVKQSRGTTPAAAPKDLLQAINEVRSKGCKCGGTYMPPVKPVKWNSKLAAAAQSHSNYMNSRKKLSHTGNKGSDPGSRIAAAGYKWSYYAENIAMGQPTTEAVMYSWLNSAGHCKNIMNKNATDIGAAKSGAYWTLDLAAPF